MRTPRDIPVSRTDDGRIRVGSGEAAVTVVNRTRHDDDGIDIGRHRDGDRLRHICNGEPGDDWGNPHPVDDIDAADPRHESIARFEEDLRQVLRESDAWRSALEALAGATLVGWCAPKDCHGVVLAQWAVWLAE
jgi:hypothetical protein